MDQKFLLLKDKQGNKGFTLIEVLLVLYIILSTSLLIVPRQKEMAFIKEPVSYQLEAMANQCTVKINQNLWFNKNGNINHGQTQLLGKKKCIFQLGMGRYRCE